MRRNGDSDERVESVVIPPLWSCNPISAPIVAWDWRRTLRLSASLGESLQRSKVDIVSLNGRAHQEL